jgi:hypothetical protein
LVKDECARESLRAALRRVRRDYDRAVLVCEAGGEALGAAALGPPKMRAPTPISNNKVISATETTAKL